MPKSALKSISLPFGTRSSVAGKLNTPYDSVMSQRRIETYFQQEKAFVLSDRETISADSVEISNLPSRRPPIWINGINLPFVAVEWDCPGRDPSTWSSMIRCCVRCSIWMWRRTVPEVADFAVSAASNCSPCPYLFAERRRHINELVEISERMLLLARFIYRMYHVRSTNRRSVISYDVGYLVCSTYAVECVKCGRLKSVRWSYDCAST